MEKPEIDFEPDTDPYDERVYAKGRENLQTMIEKGLLVKDETPSFYVYRLTRGDCGERLHSRKQEGQHP